MSILILAEHDNTALRPAVRTLVTAARKLGGAIHMAVLGANVSSITVQAAKISGVTQVLTADHAALADGLAENLAPVVTDMVKQGAYSHVLAPASTWGKNLLPRVAAALDVAQVSDVVAIHSADTFDRPIYAGNAIATVQSLDPIKVMTIRPTAFDLAPAEGGQAAVKAFAVNVAQNLSRFVSREVSKSARPELTSARVIVSGGRGLQSAENFKMLEALADTLNAAVGASRAAVDAGFVPNDYQVGQTGKVVAPDLYIAVGISGAIQHLAGMKDSKVIVSINKDEESPLMQIADYALAGDLFTIVPELTKALGKKA